VSARPIELIRKATRDFVPGILHSELRVQELVLVERRWAVERARVMAALLGAGVPRPQWPESLHWDWSSKASELQLLMASGFGVWCDEDWQGVMLTKTVGYSAALGQDEGKPVVYVDFVESAPWNWTIRAIEQEPRFKGIGSLLIREAIEQSLKEEFHGRVGLHALPQAESFYGKVCGMTMVNADQDKQGLVFFEFTRQQAEQFRSAGGKR